MPTITEQAIREIVLNTLDSDLNIPLSELDSLVSIKIKDKDVEIKINVVQPIYWIAEKINLDLGKKLKELDPSCTYEVLISELPFDVTNRKVLPGVKNIIAVSSGKGGVGKSTVAANLAAALSQKGARVGILDADVYGPSQPTMFGLNRAKLEAEQMDDGTVKARPTTKFGIKVASMGFIMEQDQAAIVRGPMLAGYFSMLFEQINWGQLDFLIIDLPPGTGDIQLTMVQKIPLTGAVVVTTPQEISLADVRRSVAMFSKVNVDILGVVENMSYFTPEDMPEKKYFIFGEGGGKKIAEETNTSLLGLIPLDIASRETNDNGMPIVIKNPEGEQAKIYKEIADGLVSKIRVKNLAKSQAPKLQIEL